MDYKGITPADAAGSYGSRPVLIVAAEKDGYSALSARKLANKIGGTAVLKMYEGKEHGTGLFAEQKDFGPFLFDWTLANFPVTSPK
jgi:hypothetical protein